MFPRRLQLDTVPLPPDIVARFAGRPMAVVGLEWDQVRRTPAGDVSVPMSVAYNHHYGTVLLGADAALERVPASDGRVPAAGHGPAVDSDGTTLVVEDRNPNSTFPNSQAFFSQNGGEARLSFKGFAPGSVHASSPSSVAHAPALPCEGAGACGCVRVRAGACVRVRASACEWVRAGVCG